MEERRREFEEKYEGAFALVKDKYPGFFVDLGDLCRSAKEHKNTRQGAVVREWPSTRDVAVQHGPSRGERCTQTEAPPPPRRAPERSRSRGGERQETRPREGRLPDLVREERANRPRERTPVRQRSSTARPAVRGCWNCGNDGHRYSTCPRPRKSADFCFGCGRAGATLRTCPRCREDWEDLGPYHQGKGHFGKRTA
ncbi:hypothetical protein ALC62_00056 [Cyphomyrmex costatus]|uniref:CCHC-type domain-containing protein n=1 Tax=Cyphomyrmex costatus TaxID=456900 RepID=A0A151K1P2_9HYME|nr:hypothetical protein ALC62_00056 [Cyphomyrmex costatus]